MKLAITKADLNTLLTSPAEEPVLYLQRDEETGEITGLDVWAAAYVPADDIVVRLEELTDELAPDELNEAEKNEALGHLAESYQDHLDNLLDDQE
ncbi:hypothetical protein ACFVDU_04415 [Streptomyces albidoflavus]